MNCELPAWQTFKITNRKSSRRSSKGRDECPQRLRVLRARHHIQIVVAGIRHRNKLLGKMRHVEKLLPMPEGDNLVLAAVDDQHRAVDLVNVFVIRKLVERQEGNSG